PPGVVADAIDDLGQQIKSPMDVAHDVDAFARFGRRAVGEAAPARKQHSVNITVLSNDGAGFRRVAAARQCKG
ncbi:hypothetical protein LTR94_033771, partial [Friedmanniomyces endolithicus]